MFLVVVFADPVRSAARSAVAILALINLLILTIYSVSSSFQLGSTGNLVVTAFFGIMMVKEIFSSFSFERFKSSTQKRTCKLLFQYAADTSCPALRWNTLARRRSDSRSESPDSGKSAI